MLLAIFRIRFLSKKEIVMEKRKLLFLVSSFVCYVDALVTRHLLAKLPPLLILFILVSHLAKKCLLVALQLD